MGASRAAALLLALVCAFGVAALFPAPTAAQSQDVNVQQELAAIRSLIAQSNQAYRAGDRAQAFKLARAAYLDHYELVEVPLRLRDPEFTLQTEYQFAHWRSRIQAGAPASEIGRITRDLDRTLSEADAVIQGPGVLAPLLTTLASFSILFREGLEAILVLAALLSYVRTHNPSLARPIWIGSGLAVPASVLTWLVLNVVLRVTPFGRELLEAVVSLAAAVMLFYVSFWLLRRLETRQWMEFLKSRVWEAVAAGNAGALATFGFISFYREGAETALFYQTLVMMAGRLWVWILVGILLATAVLAVLGWIILYLGTRVPVKAFMTVAVAMIMVLSVAMIGNAVWQLQAAWVLPLTSLVDGFPRLNPFVTNLLGLHPSVESIGVQVVLIAVYAGSAVYFYGRRSRSRRAEAVRNVPGPA